MLMKLHSIFQSEVEQELSDSKYKDSDYPEGVAENVLADAWNLMRSGVHYTLKADGSVKIDWETIRGLL